MMGDFLILMIDVFVVAPLLILSSVVVWITLPIVVLHRTARTWQLTISKYLERKIDQW